MAEGVPLHGDRAAWNNIDYQEEHAKDISTSALKNHVLGASAQGDIIIADANPYWSRLSIGANGTLLISNGTTLSYQSATGLGVGTIDTRANILATTPDAGSIAYATDTNKLYLYDGSNWKQLEIKMSTDAQVPDMGHELESARVGYGENYITDKTLSNVLLGGNARTENGGVRVNVSENPDTFEIYLRGSWQTIIYDLTTDDGDFRHAPISEDIYVWRGSSVSLGLNDRPIVNEYKVSMGAYPPPRRLNGGTF